MQGQTRLPGVVGGVRDDKRKRLLKRLCAEIGGYRSAPVGFALTADGIMQKPTAVFEQGALLMRRPKLLPSSAIRTNRVGFHRQVVPEHVLDEQQLYLANVLKQPGQRIGIRM